MSRTNVLITGINGFIGSNLKGFIETEYLSWNIYGIDCKGKESDKVFIIDIKNRRKLNLILCKIKAKYIFHMAGLTASDNLKRLFLSNVIPTFNILDSVKEIKHYHPRIVIPSSAAEYNPISLYGVSKTVQTKLSLMFAREGLDVVIARIFNIFGKGTPTNLSIGKFANELALIKRKGNKQIIHTEYLDTKRDFLDIGDVCKYLVMIGIYGKKGEIYDVCRGRSYRIRDLLYKLIDISGIKGVKIAEDQKHGKEVLLNSFGSAKKLKKILRKLKFIPITQSLKDTYSYYLTAS